LKAIKNIVLIQPETPEEYLSYNSFARFTKKPALLPPLGLVTLAALTPSYYRVIIIDERIEKIDFNIPCDLVGITGYRFYKNRMIEIAYEFKKRQVLTVGGGTYCTDYFDDALKHFDVVISGEAERTWPRFLSQWEKGVHKKSYREKKPIDIKKSPIPRWDLIKTEKYTIGSIQTSRGCPNDCDFCNVVKFYGQELRTKSRSQTFRELKRVASYGFPSVFFADDNFTGNRQHAKNILMDIIRFNRLRKKPLIFIAQTTLDLAEDDELLDLLKEANFFQLFIGIETPRKNSLIACNKLHNLNMEMIDAIKNIQSRGMFIVAGMIVGFDTDDATIFEEQRQFLKKSGITLPMINLLVAPKHTRLWHRLKREGRLLPHVAEDSFLTANYVPLLMSKEELEEGHLKLLRSVYSIEHFKESFQSFIRQIDVNRMSSSPNAAEWKHLGSMNKNILFTGMRIILFFLFQAGKEKRRLFIFVLQQTFAKGVICIPVAFSILSYFESLNRFISCKVVPEKQ